MIFMVLAIRVAALHQMAQRLRSGHGMSSRLAPAACSERNRLTSAVLFQTVALGAELGSLFQHPAEQRLSRGGGYAGALELQNLIALP